MHYLFKFKTQYTNHQMNNAVKNLIYPKNSQYIFRDWLNDMVHGALSVTKTRIPTIMRYEKRTDT